MRARKWMVVLAIAMASSVTTRSWGQARQDPRIIGAYVGAVTYHQVWGSGAGALFGFSLGYNSQGYHQAGLTSGSLFYNGRRYPLTTQMTVPPFPSPSNRDIDFFFYAPMSDLDGGPTWAVFGTLPYGKFDEVYLRDTKVSYQGLGYIPYITFTDNSPTQFAVPPGADIEAGRVSTQVLRAPTASAKIRIRR